MSFESRLTGVQKAFQIIQPIYKITEKYYNNSADKKQALYDIIELKDPKAILEKSGYGK
jgi:hypothetical protein